MEEIEALFDYQPLFGQLIKAETVVQVALKLSERLLALESDLKELEKHVLQQVKIINQPSQIQEFDNIIRLTTLTLQQATELPEKVINLALEDLKREPPISPQDMKKNIEQILNDSRNENMTNQLRDKLKAIATLIDACYFHSQLRLIPALAENWGGSLISKRHIFSLFEGYTKFVHTFIRNDWRDIQIQINFLYSLFDDR